MQTVVWSVNLSSVVRDTKKIQSIRADASQKKNFLSTELAALKEAFSSSKAEVKQWWV